MAGVNTGCWIAWHTDCPCGFSRGVRAVVSTTRRTVTARAADMAVLRGHFFLIWSSFISILAQSV